MSPSVAATRVSLSAETAKALIPPMVVIVVMVAAAVSITANWDTCCLFVLMTRSLESSSQAMSGVRGWVGAGCRTVTAPSAVATAKATLPPSDVTRASLPPGARSTATTGADGATAGHLSLIVAVARVRSAEDRSSTVCPTTTTTPSDVRATAVAPGVAPTAVHLSGAWNRHSPIPLCTPSANTITDAEGTEGSSEPYATLPPNGDPVGETPTDDAGEAPAGEAPAGEDPAGEIEDDAHPVPTSAIVAIAATSLAPVPIPISPLLSAVRPCGRLIDGHRRL